MTSCSYIGYMFPKNVELYRKLLSSTPSLYDKSSFCCDVMNITDINGVSKQKAFKLPFIELSFSHVSRQTDFDQYRWLHRQSRSLFTLMPFELNVHTSTLLPSDLHFRDYGLALNISNMWVTYTKCCKWAKHVETDGGLTMLLLC